MCSDYTVNIIKNEVSNKWVYEIEAERYMWMGETGDTGKRPQYKAIIRGDGIIVDSQGRCYQVRVG